MHVQNWRNFRGDGCELWECCQPWLQCYFSFSSSSFFMNSALTPFPAQQTFQIISNLPTQDRRLRATLCAAGFFLFFKRWLHTQNSSLCLPQIKVNGLKCVTVNTAWVYVFTDIWVYVFLFLHNALVLEAQPCDFDWIGTQLFQTNKQKKEKKRRSNVLCCCIWKEFLQC